MSLRIPDEPRDPALIAWLQGGELSAAAGAQRCSRRILVMGASTSGKAAQKLLNSLPHKPQVTVFDDKVVAKEEDLVQTPTSLNEVALQVGLHDAIVLSPGVPLTHPVPAQALAQGIPIISEVELGLACVSKTTLIAGITGTNGKSTVTHCLASVLDLHMKALHPNQDHITAVATGNIGHSVCDHVLEGNAASALAVELSSYQLETMGRAQFDLAIITNFTTDHLARYRDTQGYFQAKWRIVSLLRPGAPLGISEQVARNALNFGAVLPHGHPLWLICHNENKSPVAKPKWFSLAFPPLTPLRAPVPGYVSAVFDDLPVATWTQPMRTLTAEALGPGAFHIADSGGPAVSWTGSMLRGQHNAENLAFCRFAEAALFAEADSVMPRLFGPSSSFRNLAHRLELLPPSPGWETVTVINDSKSTSFVCTGTALASLGGPVRLLLGGQIKDRQIEQIRPSSTQATILSVDTFGPEAPWLAEQSAQLFAVTTRAHSSMAEAARAALGDLRPGETLLLSPGAASFDGFRSFSERGEAFKILVTDYCAKHILPPFEAEPIRKKDSNSGK